MLLGIDTGGTFTDFVLLDTDGIRIHKVLSTPHSPELAILRGIHDLSLCPDDFRIVHGTTVATNALLQGRGVDTVFISNRGFADMLTIGRQARENIYDLMPEKIPPPVSFEDCFETGGRISSTGDTIEALTEQDLKKLKEFLIQRKPRAVAINLLFSYLDDSFEKQIEAIVPDNIYVSRSSAVLAQYREYERGMATWINAWLGPLVKDYLNLLIKSVLPAPVAVMQSSGETINAALAADHAVRLLLSGPAGGLAGAAYIGKCVGENELLSFDMGGTSTDVALLNGEAQLTHEGHVGLYPVAVPMVDMHTIGAGGGSIAYLDEGGMLQVGPASAGADPGPACYGNGGTVPTVTDANLVLGRLQADAFLGGQMKLDITASVDAIQKLAEKMLCSVKTAAEGIIQIADEHMARALRVISVEKGIDPANRALMCFGGAGGMHVCSLAKALGMSRAIVPVHAGVLSALGMLSASPGRQLSRTYTTLLDKISEQEVDFIFDELVQQGIEQLLQEGHDRADISTGKSLDLRYDGQSFSLNVPWNGDCVRMSDDFHVAHRLRYGMSLDHPVELVNVRISLSVRSDSIKLPQYRNNSLNDLPPFKQVHVNGVDINIYARESCFTGSTIKGPAIITEQVSTTWIETGWIATVDEYLNLILRKQ